MELLIFLNACQRVPQLVLSVSEARFRILPNVYLVRKYLLAEVTDKAQC